MPIIKFKDSGFETAVKQALETAKERLHLEDLLAIKGVIFTDKDVLGFGVPWQSDSTAFNMRFPELFFNVSNSANGEWEQDLQYFTHIQTLHISVPTEDLSILSGFKKLKELYVVNSETPNWSFISNLTGLKYLYMNNCNFSDVTPLQELYLKQLKIHKKTDNQKDPFHLFDGIQNLCLKRCGIRDISPLSVCGHISELDLSHNDISDIKPLMDIRSLYYLTLRYNRIKDITPLKDIGMLYYLNLRHNFISDISVFSKLGETNLGRLFLGHNPIGDYGPLNEIHLVFTDSLPDGRVGSHLAEYYTRKARNNKENGDTEQ